MKVVVVVMWSECMVMTGCEGMLLCNWILLIAHTRVKHFQSSCLLCLRRGDRDEKKIVYLSHTMICEMLYVPHDAMLYLPLCCIFPKESVDSATLMTVSATKRAASTAYRIDRATERHSVFAT